MIPRDDERPEPLQNGKQPLSPSHLPLSPLSIVTQSSHQTILLNPVHSNSREQSDHVLHRKHSLRNSLMDGPSVSVTDSEIPSHMCPAHRTRGPFSGRPIGVNGPVARVPQNKTV
ncbi:hypothetical protein CDEST_08798 [Colletotrichum destructivum]|uniref:Uncharacterized protein n=1 Tax=Colletotrichum destructivum TaxID=34406 RepID=A0AAX4ILP1_9PEZI|nr:hypothetical protein CDEST_08798 [Colletotrichum destructivum]